MGFFDITPTAAKFTAPGDTLTGKVTAWREAPVYKWQTNEPDHWPDGSAKMQVIITLDTEERLDKFDEGQRTLYISSTRQKRALLGALHDGGSKFPDIGGVLTMTFTGFDPKSKNKDKQAKLYTAHWSADGSIPQVTEQAFDAGLNAAEDDVPTTPAEPKSAEPTQAVPSAGFDLAKVQKLIGMDLDDQTIAGALGITADQVAAVR